MSSSKITLKEVERIARLARLAPSHEQVGKLAEQLNHILDYVAKLGEVDTSAVEAPAETGAVTLRADELKPSLERDEALRAAPAAHDGGFSVPRVLEVES